MTRVNRNFGQRMAWRNERPTLLPGAYPLRT